MYISDMRNGAQVGLLETDSENGIKRPLNLIHLHDCMR
jgi:hypothetical protein